MTRALLAGGGRDRLRPVPLFSYMDKIDIADLVGPDGPDGIFRAVIYSRTSYTFFVGDRPVRHL